jgi:beta-lactamase superfamily II metal-dependent hydrolase
MPTIKSLSVGTGDMFYIRHGSSNFTIIDCNLNDTNVDGVVAELKEQSADKEITRFISTHPDGDHFGGIHLLDDAMPISNFYCVDNAATKDSGTDAFARYCQLRDGPKAFKIFKGCTRKWMNVADDTRAMSGISILWPDPANVDFQLALLDASLGESPNNISAVIRYSFSGGSSVMWLGDLETQFMEDIIDDIELTKTTVVFAAHHGRTSGKIPDS